jgi:hypothetical protein
MVEDWPKETLRPGLLDDARTSFEITSVKVVICKLSVHTNDLGTRGSGWIISLPPEGLNEVIRMCRGFLLLHKEPTNRRPQWWPVSMCPFINMFILHSNVRIL